MAITCQRCGAQLDADARFCGMCGATLVDPNVGRTVGERYVLRERLGAGSLGIVYRAEQTGLGRKLAIKLLPADPQLDPRILERFRREGELLCKFRSPHTVTTYEHGREPDGSLYIAMELLQGQTLAQLIRAEAPLESPRVLRILFGVCDSLAEAHAHGVVHRDLKPDNLWIEPRPSNRDFVKVMDFGLAKLLPSNNQLSPPGQTIGTIEYASPEQLLGKPLDARSDLYAVGVLGYLLATGHHPFHEARSYGTLVDAHIHRVAPPAATLRPDLSPDLDALLTRCLEKDPARRFPDAQALAAMLGVAFAALTPTQDTIKESELSLGDEDTYLAALPKPPH